MKPIWWSVAVALAGCGAVEAPPPDLGEHTSIGLVVPACDELACDIVDCVRCYLCNGATPDQPVAECRCYWWDVPPEGALLCKAEVPPDPI